jgi:uncharacterized protein
MRDDLIQRFGLRPHPEGGFFRETFRSAESVRRPDALNTSRSASTAIYYMLCDGAYSAWHRIRSDEVWHFYAGEPLLVHVINPNGEVTTHRLGNTLHDANAVFQAVVECGHWFSAELADPRSFALVGCTVAPGFEFNEFELGNIDALRADYPQHEALIRRLAPKGKN